ncbi:MAG: sortase [Defluviitaleaceae bacterium]|nr:sortase [Defluviitaleaceae bacterium]
MLHSKKIETRLGFRAMAKAPTIIAFVFFMLIVPITTLADNTASNNQDFSNANWQNTHHADDWNWFHSWAYQAPEYQFETAFPHEQWGRPTTSSIAPQHTQNIRRDRHSAFLPPSHGGIVGFYSGEFPTNQVNPFAPRNNNNPNAGYAVGIEESPFALLSGETGVNVRADGTHAGGFLASTSVSHGGIDSGNMGNIGSNAPHTGFVSDFASDSVPPWTASANQREQNGFTVSHVPIEHAPTQSAEQQQGRTTVVTPFEDGTIGRITLPSLNNRVVPVRSGVELSILDSYAGHFPNTSQWDGNVALASHNRGRSSFFAEIWTLQAGDRIFYETTLGVRVYEVVSVNQISEMDLGGLDHSHDNTLTLITCVYGRSELRWAVVAREV